MAERSLAAKGGDERDRRTRRSVRELIVPVRIADRCEFRVAPVYYDVQAKVESRASPRHTLPLLGITSDDVTSIVIDRPMSADPSASGNFNIATGFTQLRLRHRYRAGRLTLDSTVMGGFGNIGLSIGSIFGIDIRYDESTLRSTAEYQVDDRLTVAGGVDVSAQWAIITADFPASGRREGDPQLPGSIQDRNRVTGERFLQYYPAAWVEASLNPNDKLLVVPGAEHERLTP